MNGPGNSFNQLNGTTRMIPQFSYLVCQRATVDELHGEEVLAVDLPDFVNRDNAGMLQIGGRLSLGIEPLNLQVAGQMPGQNHLQGAITIELRLASPKDDSHTSPGNLFHDFKIAETLSFGGCRASRCSAGDAGCMVNGLVTVRVN